MNKVLLAMYVLTMLLGSYRLVTAYSICDLQVHPVADVQTGHPVEFDGIDS